MPHLLQPPQGPKLTALDKNGLLVQLVPVKGSDCMKIFMTTTNSSDNTLEQYLLKVKLVYYTFYESFK